ncbi:MAG: transglycosylase domain-containing protein [Proteobacteria bacterium]|nr:transglycosylase domain-containing protein [Pseudomonadota bacterium]
MLEKPRVVVANRADGGILYWAIKLYGFAFASLAAVLLVVGFFVYRHFAGQAPSLPDLASYTREVPAVSGIYAFDGTLMGEFATEWREVVSYQNIPKPLVDAFLAAEDHDFFNHNGLYFRGILRAAWANAVAGDFAQGGSTITQQVAKQFVGDDKSLSRKAIEAVLARRLEARFSKKAILSLYLNHIYLGGGAYGVKAAARRYFSKPLTQLDLGEAALIAGLAKAPSSYSPLRNRERALARRNEVLDRMALHGFIDSDTAGEWKQKPLILRPYQDLYPNRMPHFTEHARRHVIERYGLDALMKNGLRIETTAQPAVQGTAAENVDFNSRKQDKRQGWRGPEWYVEGKARDMFIARARAMYGDGPLEEGRRYLGLVEKVRVRGAWVRVGAAIYLLPLRNMSWAAEWTPHDSTNDREIDDPRAVLKKGDVIWVSRERLSRGRFRDWRLEQKNPRWRASRKPRKRELRRPVQLVLEQVAHPQSALLSADHKTGYVVAMVGGNDFSRSQYNRAVQACRQPGSTYKPVYYSAALADGYGYDSLFNDVPRPIVDPVTGEVWIPTNIDGSSTTQVTLEYALVRSKNVPSVAIFEKLGADRVKQWARRLGFTTEIIADKALALGASCTTLDELTRAFAILARNGRWIDWVYVRRIIDRSGRVVEDNTVFYDPMLSAPDRVDRIVATADAKPAQVIPARAAFLTGKLLSEAVSHGFTSVIRQTGIHAAGKTGTSSAEMDVTFVAYTSRWITSVWLGDDQRVRPLGRKAAAYRDVVPLWARYMYDVARDHPNHRVPWQVPAGVDPDDRGDHSKGEQGEPMALDKRNSIQLDDAERLSIPHG